MKNKFQKLKLLRIWDILRQDTDEEHTLSTVQLMERLAEEDIVCERKSVYDDVRMLQEFGYPVMVKRTRVNEYYVADRSFSAAELRMLMDSVQAANFLSAAKTKELTLKIAALAGSAKGERLKGSTTFVQRGKRNLDQMTQNIEALQTALERKRRIRFRYFNLDVNKRRVYRTAKDGGEWYEASPRGLVCHNDNYYLVAVLAGSDHYYTFRIDRLDGVSILRDKVETPSWCRDLPVAKFLKGSFGMYAGDKVRVTMLCDNDPKVIDMVLDEFGYDVNLVDTGDGHFYLATEVQVSPNYFAWLMGMGDKVRLYGPEDVVGRYRKALADALAVE